MRRWHWLLCCGLLTLPALAQPESWQRFEGDFYNPVGFPATSGPVTVGDFNGDGRAEFFGQRGANFVIARRDSGDNRFWHSAEAAWSFGPAFTAWASDLDGDGADELVLYGDSVRVYRALSGDALSWQRHDAMFGPYALRLPLPLTKAVYGDYDQDGLLEAVCWQETSVLLFERTAAGAWERGDVVCENVLPGAMLLDGDFDHDGDADFLLSRTPRDTPLCAAFGESTAGGLVLHAGTDAELAALDYLAAGGDLDGDGAWEGLYRYPCFEGYHLAEMEMTPGVGLWVSQIRYIGAGPRTLVGRFQTASGPVLAGARTGHNGDPFHELREFALWSQTEAGWEPFSNGFHSTTRIFGGGSMGDVDGDGRPEIVGTLTNTMTGWPNFSLMYWPNGGTEQADIFDAADYLMSRINGNYGTFWSTALPLPLPQLGDITGDGRAELAVPYLIDGNQNPSPLFFEYNTADGMFVPHVEWSAGLPWEAQQRFRLADVDNDGVAECFSFIAGAWQSHVRRAGVWEITASLLPEGFADSTLTFADADGDGDADVFSQTDVWLNQRAAAVAAPVVPQPASAALGAYPNPFNATTRVRFSLAQPGRVELELFDLLGRRVARLGGGDLQAGEHTRLLDGAALPAGLYFVRLTTVSQTLTTKLLLLK